MIALGPIIAELKAAGYGQVEGLFEFAQLKSPPRNLPALYVIPNRTDAQGAPRLGAYDQKLTFGFSVVIVMALPARSTAGVSEQLRDELRRVNDALFGWQHPEAASGCYLAAGLLLDLDAATLSWRQDFTTTYRERKVA
jgi:hypothetical protein